VGSDPIFLPLRRFGCVLDEARVKIADPAAGKPERVSSKKTVEVVVYELPVEREVVGYKDRPAIGLLIQPRCERFHHRFGVIKTKMLLP